jgi:hypothetical protein
MSSLLYTRLPGAAPLWAALAMLPVGYSSAQAQLELTVHGGIHSARLDRPERGLEQPARGISIQSAAGEATALGLRAGGTLGLHWRWDAGFVWSQNHSAIGSVGPTVPDFETHTIFVSSLIQALLTSPEARLGLRAGAGPALILHRGSGSSLLTRQADVGGMLNLSSKYSLDGRLAIRLDAQEYLFSSSFREPYAGQFVGVPVQPAGPQFRHEFILLAGLSWLTH